VVVRIEGKFDLLFISSMISCNRSIFTFFLICVTVSDIIHKYTSVSILLIS